MDSSTIHCFPPFFLAIYACASCWGFRLHLLCLFFVHSLSWVLGPCNWYMRAGPLVSTPINKRAPSLGRQRCICTVFLKLICSFMGSKHLLGQFVSLWTGQSTSKVSSQERCKWSLLFVDQPHCSGHCICTRVVAITTTLGHILLSLHGDLWYICTPC